MNGVYIILGAVGLLLIPFLLLCIPAWIYLRFDEKLTVSLRFLGKRFLIFDGESTKQKDKPSQSVKKTTASPSAKTKNTPQSKLKKRLSSLQAQLQKEGIAGYWQLINECLGDIHRFFGTAKRICTISSMQLDCLLAGDEPDVLALRYGKWCGIVYTAQALLEQTVRVKFRRIRLQPHFLAEDTVLILDMTIRVCPLRIAWASAVCAYRLWRHTEHKLNGVQIQGG